MSAARVRVFREGDGLIVPLPTEVGFGVGTELIVACSGDVLTLHRPMATIAEMIEKLQRLPVPPKIEDCSADVPAEPR